MELQPGCAICSCRTTPEFPQECPHEGEALQKALNQAIERSETMRAIKDWVLNQAKRQIARTFEEFRTARVEAHTRYIQTLPCYAIYRQYRGNPPIHAPQLHNLRYQIAQAGQVLQQGIDEDWRNSCLTYPGVLDYYLGLIEVSFPNDEDESVIEPDLGRASPAPAVGGARRPPQKARRGSGDWSHDGHKPHKRKERRRSRARTRTPPPAAPMADRYRR